jgi:ACS family glucarate transporter-like MFS transporter
VNRIGARTVFAIAVAWWSVFTAATAVARGFGSLFGLRLLLGVGEAGAFPSATRVVEEWFPRHERVFASGIYDSGARGGTLVAIPVVSALIAALGWRGSFLVTGAIGLIWVIIWLIIYRSPFAHRWVSKAEVAYIESGGGARPLNREERPSIPWKSFIRNRTIWGMALGFGCQSYVIYFFITWFPTYLVDARGFTLLELGFWGTLPGLVAFVGNFLGGWVSDAFVRHGHSVTFARKTCIVGGMLVSSSIGLASLASSSAVALGLLTLSFTGVTFATSSIVTLPVDINPESGRSMAASIQGFQNCISNFAGIISPAVIGVLYGLTGGFSLGLASAALVALVGCLIYIFMVGKIEPLDAEELQSVHGKDAAQQGS